MNTTIVSSDKLPACIGSIVNIVLGFGFSFWICWKMALIASPLILVFSFGFQKYAKAKECEEEDNGNSNVNSKLKEKRSAPSQISASSSNYESAGAIAGGALNNIKTMQAYNGQENESKRYNGFLEEARKEQENVGIAKGLGYAILMGSAHVMTGLGYIIAAKAGWLDERGDLLVLLYIMMIIQITAVGAVVKVLPFIGMRVNSGTPARFGDFFGTFLRHFF